MDSPSAGGQYSGARVVVTGASGFIGSTLSAALRGLGAEVTGLDRRRSPDGTPVELADVTDGTRMRAVLSDARPDLVVHLAAQPIVSASSRHDRRTVDTNVNGTYVLLDLLRERFRGAAVILASTDKVHGFSGDRDSPGSGALGGSVYEATKVLVDMAGHRYAAAYGMRVAVARLANVYGGGDRHWSRLVPGTCRAIVLGRPVALRGPGTSRRDYLHLSDAVDAYVRLGLAALRAPAALGAFDFGTGSTAEAIEVVEALLELAGVAGAAQVVTGSEEPASAALAMDAGRARGLLGWSARVPLREGLGEALRWYEAHLAEQPPV